MLCLPTKALSPTARVTSRWLLRSLVPALPCLALGTWPNLKSQDSPISK